MLVKDDCEEVAEKILEKAKENLRNLYQPSLSIYTNGSSSCLPYVLSKIRACTNLGIDCKVYAFSKPSVKDVPEIKRKIQKDSSTAIIIQLPFSDDPLIDKELIRSIPHCKDVDGLTKGGLFIPATAFGIRKLLSEECLLDEPTHVVIIGRSDLVGKPLANLLISEENATVTVCHSKTKNLKKITKEADIIVVAVGKKGFLTKDMVKPTAYVIDVGINRDEEGKLCGDVASDVSDICDVTPVPGGVGKLTVASLMLNISKTGS